MCPCTQCHGYSRCTKEGKGVKGVYLSAQGRTHVAGTRRSKCKCSEILPKGTGRIAQWVKGLICKHEDLSSNPLHPYKKKWTWSCVPLTPEQQSWEGCWDSGYQPSCRSRERPRVRGIEQRVIEQDTQHPSLVSAHVQAYAYLHAEAPTTHACIHT